MSRWGHARFSSPLRKRIRILFSFLFSFLFLFFFLGGGLHVRWTLCAGQWSGVYFSSHTPLNDFLHFLLLGRCRKVSVLALPGLSKFRSEFVRGGGRAGSSVAVLAPGEVAEVAVFCCTPEEVNDLPAQGHPEGHSEEVLTLTAVPVGDRGEGGALVQSLGELRAVASALQPKTYTLPLTLAPPPALAEAGTPQALQAREGPSVDSGAAWSAVVASNGKLSNRELFRATAGPLEVARVGTPSLEVAPRQVILRGKRGPLLQICPSCSTQAPRYPRAGFISHPPLFFPSQMISPCKSPKKTRARWRGISRSAPGSVVPRLSGRARRGRWMRPLRFGVRRRACESSPAAGP